jgi:hypothetical protein
MMILIRITMILWTCPVSVDSLVFPLASYLG